MTNKQAEEQKKDEEQSVKEQAVNLPLALDAIRAPLWRRFAATIVDMVISLFFTGIFFLSMQNPNATQAEMLLYMASLVITQAWLFIFLPTNYMRGQTIGRKIFRLYCRDVYTKRTASWWKYFMRDFFFKITLVMGTMPLSLVYVLYQYLRPMAIKEIGAQQQLVLFDKKLTLIQDTIFSTEVVYREKVAKRKEEPLYADRRENSIK